MTAPIDWDDDPEPQPDGPIGWARQQQTERTQRAPDRQTADTITDNDLDRLYGELGLTTHLLANVRETCTTALNRAERAERLAQSAARDTAKALSDYLAAEQRAEQAEAVLTRLRDMAAAARASGARGITLDALDTLLNLPANEITRLSDTVISHTLSAASSEPKGPTP
ncbi:hypothetical protein [Streptomyces goshikiensis]